MVMEFAFACRESLNPSYMVCVSAEGKAARACLMKENRILSEVWLYNLDSAPEAGETDETYNENAAEFVAEKKFVITKSKDQITVRWFRLNGAVLASIYIDEVLHATLISNELIGRCRLAKKNGPLAKVLKPLA